jgi:hypothetical protein
LLLARNALIIVLASDRQPSGMVTTFTQQGATMRHEMCQQIAPLHSAASQCRFTVPLHSAASQCNWQFFKSGSNFAGTGIAA